jgi:DNA-binding XRE family transcriptional regulator
MPETIGSLITPGHNPAVPEGMAALGHLSDPADAQPEPGLPPRPGLDSTGSTLPARTIVIDGQRLRQLRLQHGLSQEKLADRAGISLTTMARLERQPRASCRGRTLGRLAAALGEQTATIAEPGPDRRAASPNPIITGTPPRRAGRSR